MALNWQGYNQVGNQSNKAMSSFGEKLGGLLGKMKAPGFMTDNKGMFQGGKHGRAFGRVKDMLGMPGKDIDYGSGASGYIDSEDGMSQVQYSVDDEDALYNTLLGTQVDGESVETENIDYGGETEDNSFFYQRPEYNFSLGVNNQGYKLPEYVFKLGGKEGYKIPSYSDANSSFSNAGGDSYQMPQHNNPNWFQGYQTNPSEVDKDLAGGPNYSLNSGGGQNWRQGY